MTAKAALCKALLNGEVLNIKNVFKATGITNAPREISRMVEAPFGVEVSRTHKKGKSRYGTPVSWIDYYLVKSEHNLPGIEKMEEYVGKHTPKSTKPESKTEIQTNKLF
jgi:hypothetical protein